VRAKRKGTIEHPSPLAVDIASCFDQYRGDNALCPHDVSVALEELRILVTEHIIAG
jgi:hypothetical protein